MGICDVSNLLFISLHNVIPSMTGIMTSEMIRSMSSVRMILSASIPFVAVNM